MFGGTTIGAAGTINLSSLNGSDGFTINGINVNDQSGVSVSSAGDVNNDGASDLIIGASGANPNGASSGQSYVIFGIPSPVGNPADLDGDGNVGSGDLAIVLGSWGPCPPMPAECAADLDGDGNVGSSDLAILLGSWGS